MRHDPGRKLLVGLIGAGIGRSLTPALHEAEAQAQGLRLHYQLIDLDASASDVSVLPQLLHAAKLMGFAGLNITYPAKQAVIPLLDALSDEAAAIGAVNTVVFTHGQAVGHNTDCSGWRRGFEQQLPRADLRCVALLGAGGAGSAVAHALLRMGCKALHIVDSDAARAQALAQRLGELYSGAVRCFDAAGPALDGATGLVNATPVGMLKQPGMPLAAALLHPRLWVSEVVYVPLHTELLQAARATGCFVADGGGMAVGQAVDAFALFTGQSANAQRMHAHFNAMI